MQLKNNQKLVREIGIILVVKVFFLMLIKSIWFDAPTIPKGIDSQVATHIAGSSPAQQESSR
ncbi:cytochrome oxidase putative small subunit CydP [Acinetobacter marinus]|uniref:cytochrome oxidase putative small subunit CydP n=1 Tax=Acinetobacter marinus TaxID=281375 RepID=UPI000AEEBB89|nr:cytochrome oxidase putative small subunit CydP [Acinetobacter marinus]